MTILLTGATGFVIANVVRHLAEEGHDVLAADLNQPHPALRGFLGDLRGRVEFRQLDVTDRDATARLVAETRPARILHGAALTSIPPDVERARFLATADVNVIGTLNVLEAVRRAGGGRVVVVSSGSIYGPRPDLAVITEDDPANPEGLYAITKWSAEALARRFGRAHGMDVAATRLASPFGPFERDTGSRPLLSPLREWTVAAVRGTPAVVLGAAVPPRDWIYAADIGSGIAAVLLADRLPHDVYNVGWGRLTSADEALAALGRLVPSLAVERRPAEASPWSASPARGPLSVDRLRQDLGWAPRHDLAGGLAAYVEWTRANVAIA